MREVSFFPYGYRPHQRDIIEKVLLALEKRHHLVMESGTGTGKTITTLAPAVEFALEHGFKVIFTTHTNSQQVQVIRESRMLKEKMNGIFSFFAMGLQGRASMCLLSDRDPEIGSGSPEELSRLCSDRKKRTLEILRESSDASADHSQDPGMLSKGCPFFARLNTDQQLVDSITAQAMDLLPTAEELFAGCREKGICPYELSRKLLKHADLVVLPYIWVFHPFLRTRLFEMMGTSPDETILIVDEAHNLVDYARELASFDMTRTTIDHIFKEAQEYGDGRLGDTTTVTGFAEAVSRAFFGLRNSYIVEPSQEDALVPSGELNAEIMGSLACPDGRLKRVYADAKAYGDMVRNDKRERGKLMRSYVHSLSSFLMMWEEVNDGPYVRLVDISRGEDDPFLEAFCMDPSVLTKVVDEHWASIHMSGTLQPLEEYSTSLGSTRPMRTEIFPSPFPRDNLLKLCVEDVTTRYDDLRHDPELFPKLLERVVEVLKASNRSTAVFFNSYSMMGRMLEAGLVEKVGAKRHIYSDVRGMDQRLLMAAVEEFRSDRKAPILLSVMGGRVSEGLDFPGSSLEVALIVGIPYPKPTAKQQALQFYYDMKYSRGWEFTVSAPAVRRMLQAIGRIQRTGSDRGVAILMDRRAMALKRYLGRLVSTVDPLGEIDTFFGDHPQLTTDGFVTANTLLEPR